MKKLFVLMAVAVSAMAFTGCGKEEEVKVTTLDPSPRVETEHILVENIEVEEILTENTIYWEDADVTAW